MCEDCGCRDTIRIDRVVTEDNDKTAHQIWHDLKEAQVFCINIMGAPGSGKTTFIEGIAKHVDPGEIAVIQGDLESDIDKQRLLKSGIYTYQINTHSGCHLNADMIKKALSDMNLDCKKYLFIENVGNLVCPAGVKLGQHMDLVVSSTTEGSDKPKKYPIIFMDAGLVVISKHDLADAVEFDEKKYHKDMHKITGAKIFRTSKNKEKSFLGPAKFFIDERKHFLAGKHVH